MVVHHANPLPAIKEFMKDDLLLFNRAIHQCCATDIQKILDISKHIIDSGGKKIRPLIVLAVARACGYQGHQHADLAAMIELVHIATLLHDDVVDQAALRRGKRTAHVLFGNAASVLVGDFLYTRAFQIMVSTQIMEILAVMADTTNKTAEGEVLQLVHAGNTMMTEDEYMAVIDKKTAQLFCAAAQVGGLIAGAGPHDQKNLAQYGYNVGLTFQLIDDLLDYTADSRTFGKNRGQDLSEGKITLPIIQALIQSSPDDRTIIQVAFAQKNSHDFPKIHKILEKTHALQYVRQKAAFFSQQAKNAIENLLDSQFKTILLELADFAVHRDQ